MSTNVISHGWSVLEGTFFGLVCFFVYEGVKKIPRSLFFKQSYAFPYNFSNMVAKDYSRSQIIHFFYHWHRARKRKNSNNGRLYFYLQPRPRIIIHWETYNSIWKKLTTLKSRNHRVRKRNRIAVKCVPSKTLRFDPITFFRVTDSFENISCNTIRATCTIEMARNGYKDHTELRYRWNFLLVDAPGKEKHAQS